LHDDDASLSALEVKIFLATHGVVEISHPPCSPDLAPQNAFLFPKFQTALKGNMFQDGEYIKQNVMAELNVVPLEVFADYLQEFFKRYKSVFK
jgi:hypothetical protein